MDRHHQAHRQTHQPHQQHAQLAWQQHARIVEHHLENPPPTDDEEYQRQHRPLTQAQRPTSKPPSRMEQTDQEARRQKETHCEDGRKRGEGSRFGSSTCPIVTILPFCSFCLFLLLLPLPLAAVQPHLPARRLSRSFHDECASSASIRGARRRLRRSGAACRGPRRGHRRRQYAGIHARPHTQTKAASDDATGAAARARAAPDAAGSGVPRRYAVRGCIRGPSIRPGEPVRAADEPHRH